MWKIVNHILTLRQTQLEMKVFMKMLNKNVERQSTVHQDPKLSLSALQTAALTAYTYFGLATFASST